MTIIQQPVHKDMSYFRPESFRDGMFFAMVGDESKRQCFITDELICNRNAQYIDHVDLCIDKENQKLFGCLASYRGGRINPGYPEWVNPFLRISYGEVIDENAEKWDAMGILLKSL